METQRKRVRSLHAIVLVWIVAACGACCNGPRAESDSAAPPYVVPIVQGLDSTDPADRERALGRWGALPEAQKRETGIWLHRHASDRAWLAGAMYLDDDVLYSGSFDDTRILAERWLRLAGLDREWYTANGFSESTMHAHEVVGLADLGRAFSASAAPAVAAALEEGRVGDEFREEAIAYLLDVGGPRVASALASGIALIGDDREAARDAGLLPPKARPGEKKPPERAATALDWIYGAPQRPLSRLGSAKRARVVAELREMARDSVWIEGTARLLAEAIVSEGLPAWIEVLDGAVAERQLELLRALPRDLALIWIRQRPALGAKLPADERALLTGAALPAPLLPLDDDDSPWLSLDKLVQLVRWRVSGALPDLLRVRDRLRQIDVLLLAQAALTSDNEELKAFFRDAPLGRIEDLLLMEDFSVYVAPAVAEALLDLMRRGQRSSRDCQRELAEVFRAQVDIPAASASPAALIEKAELWARWWNREGRKWTWDAWSKRYWPATKR